MARWLVSVVVVALAGCGYQLSGESAFLPKDVRTIYIEPLINRSRDVGIDKEMTTALRAEFYRRGKLRVVDQIEQADAILTGIVQTLENHVASVNRFAEVLQYESIMTVDVTLRRREPDEIIWQGQGIRLDQLYNGSRGAVLTTSSAFQTGTLNSSDIRQLTDIQVTESESKQLRGRLMEQFATELHQRLMEMF
jgi:outer membrane lipopolysaccharide assembly protein LptE/RlpB